MNWEAIDEEIRALRTLVAEEKSVDFEKFQHEMNTLGQKQKVEKGLSWHPSLLQKSGYTLGNRAFVVLKKIKQTDLPHRFRAGAPVIVYPSSKVNQKSDRPEKTGVVYFVDRKKMKVILNTEELPFWIDEGELSVDLQFDERTYREMENAIHQLLMADGGRIKQMKGFFYGAKQVAFDELPELQTQALNPSQHEAVQHMLAAKDVAIIHGPPGTGKTTTVVEGLYHLAQRKEKILVCAPSNAAVDLLAERASLRGLNVVRIGNISRVDENILSLTLDARINDHPDSKHIKKVRQEAEVLRKKTGRFKKWGQRAAREENIALIKELRDLRAWVRNLETRLLEEVLFQADVIACTLINATHSNLRKINFTVAVIDEAAQALSPACWIPILRVPKVILAGDPHQLPPTVKSNKAKKGGLDITLLEMAIRNFHEKSLLNIQYRMHEDIMNFSNQQFYEGALQAAAHVKDWKIKGWQGKSLIYIDTAGCGFNEDQNPKSLSKFNEGEYFIFREHLLGLIKTIDLSTEPSIGFISPYKEQTIYTSEKLEEENELEAIHSTITINTIDGFQGQERDIVYISLVRSNDNAEIGFLNDYRRMNVAMTRARKLLVVIGDSATIGVDKFYNSFLEYAEQTGAYETGWSYMAQ